MMPNDFHNEADNNPASAGAASFGHAATLYRKGVAREEIVDDFEFVFDFEAERREQERDIWYLIV